MVIFAKSFLKIDCELTVDDDLMLEENLIEK